MCWWVMEECILKVLVDEQRVPPQKKSKQNIQVEINNKCAEMYEERWKLKQALHPIAVPEPAVLRSLAAGSSRGVFLL